MQDIDDTNVPCACAKNDGAYFLSVEHGKLKVNFRVFKSKHLTLAAEA